MRGGRERGGRERGGRREEEEREGIVVFPLVIEGKFHTDAVQIERSLDGALFHAPRYFIYNFTKSTILRWDLHVDPGGQ